MAVQCRNAVQRWWQQGERRTDGDVDGREVLEAPETWSCVADCNTGDSGGSSASQLALLC